MASATQTKKKVTVMLILHWFPQHLVGQMLEAKKHYCRFDITESFLSLWQMLMKVKPRNGIYLYFASEGRKYNLLLSPLKIRFPLWVYPDFHFPLHAM